MSSIRVEIDQELLDRLRGLQEADIAAAMAAVGEAIRTSTLERFNQEKDPEGRPWKKSIRAQQDGGKTLTVSRTLATSIHSESSSKGVEVGTNLIYAATHQFGDRNRTIRRGNGGTIHIDIPARPYMGITEEDMQEITHIIEDAVMEE